MLFVFHNLRGRPSIGHLLKLVSRAYFTKETVEKEQGIIGQEIKMYDDSPEWRMMFALLQSMYHQHPVREDIAGTVESIAQITPEMLYDCVKPSILLQIW